MKILKNINVWVDAENNLASDAFLKKVNFKFTRRFVDITKEGWIGVYLEWNADITGFKHGHKNHISYCGNEVKYCLHFPEVKYRYKNYDSTTYSNFTFQIEIGLNLIRDKVFKKYINMNYEPKFHENLGYGAIVWFAPKDWDKKVKRIEEE